MLPLVLTTDTIVMFMVLIISIVFSSEEEVCTRKAKNSRNGHITEISAVTECDNQKRLWLIEEQQNTVGKALALKVRSGNS
jgi:hypothetical protein